MENSGLSLQVQRLSSRYLATEVPLWAQVIYDLGTWTLRL